LRVGLGLDPCSLAILIVLASSSKVLVIAPTMWAARRIVRMTREVAAMTRDIHPIIGSAAQMTWPAAMVNAPMAMLTLRPFRFVSKILALTRPEGTVCSALILGTTTQNVGVGTAAVRVPDAKNLQTNAAHTCIIPQSR
jgi:hypothetical protein